MFFYIEKDAFDFEITQYILQKFNPKFITINHYKDIFNRSKQNFNYQKSQNRFILAVNRDVKFYKGSKFCDSRGFDNFFYSTQILGCIYNCEYCYLAGLYNSGYSVIFVNEDDFINRAYSLNNSFLAISYESDLLAFEGMYPFHKKWIELAKNKSDIFIESRTKSANVYKLPKNPPKNFLLTFSLSPNEVTIFEKKSPSLQKRVEAIKEALNRGYRVEIAVDPIIKVDNFKKVYKEFANYLKNNLPMNDISFSFGAFRMSSDLLKKIKKVHLSKVVYYPFEVKNKEVRYKDEKEMVEFVKSLFY